MNRIIKRICLQPNYNSLLSISPFLGEISNRMYEYITNIAC